MTAEESNAAGPASCGASSIDRLIERWWDDHFPGSAIARDTQAWNVAYAAKQTLKQLLKGSI